MPQKTILIEGESLTHRVLWDCAMTLRLKGEDIRKHPPQVWGQFFISATVMTYFALEAHLNFLLEIVCHQKHRDEKSVFSKGDSRGTLGKLCFLAQELAIDIPKGQRPYQTIKSLNAYRDQIVHGKRQPLSGVVMETDLELGPPLVADVYKPTVGDFLQRVIQDVEQVCDQLQQAALQKFPESNLHGDRAFVGILGHQGTVV